MYTQVSEYYQTVKIDFRVFLDGIQYRSLKQEQSVKIAGLRLALAGTWASAASYLAYKIIAPILSFRLCVKAAFFTALLVVTKDLFEISKQKEELKLPFTDLLSFLFSKIESKHLDTVLQNTTLKNMWIYFLSDFKENQA